MKAADQHAIVQSSVTAADGPVWERRPRETGRAYDYFLAYRAMGLQRNMSELARMFGTSYLNLRKIANRNDWGIRVAAWDNRLAKERDDAALVEARRMGERQARLGMKMQSIGGDRLDKFAADPVLAATLTAGDTIRLVKEGAELERAARGEDPDKGKSGNIIFNINMPAPPKWAPKSIATAVETVIEGVQASDGDKSK